MWENVSVVLGIIGGAITMTGILVRFTLVPYIEKHMMESINVVLGEVLETKAEIVAVARMFDGHLEWSQTEVDRIWDRLNRRKDA